MKTKYMLLMVLSTLGMGPMIIFGALSAPKIRLDTWGGQTALAASICGLLFATIYVLLMRHLLRVVKGIQTIETLRKGVQRVMNEKLDDILWEVKQEGAPHANNKKFGAVLLMIAVIASAVPAVLFGIRALPYAIDDVRHLIAVLIAAGHLVLDAALLRYLFRRFRELWQEERDEDIFNVWYGSQHAKQFPPDDPQTPNGAGS